MEKFAKKRGLEEAVVLSHVKKRRVKEVVQVSSAQVYFFSNSLSVKTS